MSNKKVGILAKNAHTYLYEYLAAEVSIKAAEAAEHEQVQERFFLQLEKKRGGRGAEGRGADEAHTKQNGIRA